MQKYFKTIILLLSFICSTDHVLANTNKVVAVEYRLKFFKEALSLLKNDIGRYPTSMEGLNILFENPESIDNWNGPYFNNNFLPHDYWNNPYIYKYIEKTGGVKYIIYSFGENQINEYGFGDDISIDDSEVENYKVSKFEIFIGVLCFLFGVALGKFWRHNT